MYEKYWSLADKPFRNTPDPHYFYFSRQHEEALTRALYVITEGQGAMMLTGDCGCGKTMVTRTLVDELDPDRFEVALLAYPNLSASGFLSELLRQFGYEPSGWEKAQMLKNLSDFLHATSERGASTLIIIDEAQMILDQNMLEEIRLLLNFQQDRKFFLTLVLTGQPELKNLVEDKPQLSQRLSVRYHIGAMSNEEALAYFSHRLKIAGGNRDIFTREAEEEIIRNSRGIPRRINHLADMALLIGFGKKQALIDRDIIVQILADLEG